MKWVVDISFLVSQFMPDKQPAVADDFFYQLKSSDDLYIPHLTWYELCNVLAVSVQRKRITSEQATIIFQRIKLLPLKTETVIDQESIVNIAHTYKLSGYDAVYIDLAIKMQAGLASLDKQLIEVAKKLDISLFKTSQ